MNPDTVGVVVIAQDVTLHLSRDLAWLLGVVTLVGLATCVMGAVAWWQDATRAVRRRLGGAV